MDYDALDVADALARVDALRADIDAMRPLNPEQVGRAMQRLRLEWTYHSNAIEGNTLSRRETAALLMEGVTAHGKPLKDHLDIQHHREALDFLEGFIRREERLTLAVIRHLHLLLMGETYEVQAETPDGQRIRREERGGEFKAHPNHVRTVTGEIHYYASPEETPALMTDLMDTYDRERERVDRGGLHPLTLSAVLHHRLVEIHPFPDGNGRTARVLMNLLLMQAGYPPAVIRKENDDAYFGVLAQADAGDLTPFIEFVADELAATMELYLRVLRNEPDPDAFSRRVALLRREVETAHTETLFDTSRRAHLARDFVIPLFERTSERVSQIRPLFGQVEHLVAIVDASGGQRFNRQALDALRTGDWVSFRPHWQLIGLRAEPAFRTMITYEGHVGDTSFAFSARPFRSTRNYSASSPPNPEEVEQVLDAVFEPVLSLMEKAVRRVDPPE